MRRNAIWLLTALSFTGTQPALASLGVTRSIEQEFPRIVFTGGTTAPPSPSSEVKRAFPAQAGVASTPGGAAAPSAPEEEGAVDLAALDAGGAPAAPAAGGSSYSGGHGGGSSPTFKVYFDFMLYLRPNAGNLSFDSFHNLLLFEVMPTPDLSFTFEVRQVPRYFELDYRVNDRLKLRVGKIWIPFDQFDPHNIYGGRTNVSRLTQGSSTFLPDIWADLGVGVKYLLLDSTAFSLEADAYVVNGFRSGGTDPTGDGEEYPSFSTPGLGPDNNRDKALGGRLHATIAGKFGLGSSIYMGRYNSQDVSEAQGITAMAFDGSARLEPFELRAGYAGMNVGLASGDFTRGGWYGELGWRFKERWKLLARTGSVQLDNRVLDVTDMQIVGAHLLYRMGPFELGFEHSRDLTVRSAKTNYTFTALRLVVGL